MRVFAYTDDLAVERIDMPVEEIVADKIDPWRLDLFDPDPILLEAYPGLRFRGLQDVSFAYPLEGMPQRFVLGLHDGKSTTCITGVDEGWVPPFACGHVSLTEVQEVSGGFERHWKEYLTRVSKLRQYQRKSSMSQTEPGCPPTFPQAFRMQGNRVVYENSTIHRQLEPFSFVGEMFAPRTVTVKLPEKVDWVFNQLHSYDPIVVGEALRNSLLGDNIKVVEFLIRHGSRKALWDWVVREQYESMQTWATDKWIDIAFYRGDCWYICSEFVHTSIDSMFSGREFYSAERVYTQTDGLVHGSRIALLDISNNHARKLDSFSMHVTGEGSRAGHLRKQGLTVLPNDFDGPTTAKKTPSL